ncbi:MAG: hypothetical protein M3032_09570, partial [Verrucomicrobiota bacterium]|nr:hypothetical protein [Verrucomicrobiota bacterium]
THGRGIYDTSIPPATATPTPGGDTATKLTSVSTRGPVGSGDDVMIAGIIVNGSAAKPAVVRGMGPSLATFGIASAIGDTTLELHDAQGTQIAFNDDYGSNSTGDLAVLSAYNLTPRDAREAAIVRTLPPGNYTAVMRGKTNGMGLLEAYDIRRDIPGDFLAVSTRGRVEPNDDGTMIVGFVIAAPAGFPATSKRVVIRARGPSLAENGVRGVLQDPTMDVYRGVTKIYSNDNWGTQTSSGVGTPAEIQATGFAPPNSKEPAILVTLEPGSYTAVIRGRNNTAGVAIGEVYRINE